MVQPGNHVLLVDDDDLIRKTITGSLVAAGYFVRAAVDGLDALSKLRVWLPDLLIADLCMPRMSGFELVAVMRKRFPQIPIIVFSGAGDEMPERLAADAYLPKNEAGLQQLLPTVSALTRIPHVAAPLLDECKPAEARWDGDGHWVLDCKDCLRLFSVPNTLQAGKDEKCVTCVHCGRVIRFHVPVPTP